MSRFVKVSGKRFPLPGKKELSSSDWKFTARPGGWIIAESPRGERRRFSFWEARGHLGASLEGRLLYGEMMEERRESSKPSESGADADLVAQFPGKVRKLLVKPGQQVGAGDPLILVEAMKMEFQVKAPFAGRVERVRVAEGQQLLPGDRFLDLVEPGSSEDSEEPERG